MKEQVFSIPAPKFQIIIFELEGTSNYVQHKFPQKARLAIRERHLAGSTAKKGKIREPRNFEAEYAAATYRSDKGWYGIPAGAFRAAAISACRTVGYAMTRAKLALFVEADGIDAGDFTPLVKIVHGKPQPWETMTRNETGVVDIRVRPLWTEWRAIIRVRFDADMFKSEDIANLINRVGCQVGIGEGRADSPNSTGLGFGFFKIVGEEKGGE